MPRSRAARKSGRVLVAEQAHQPPAARGRGQPLLVVEHHEAVVADAERPGQPGEAAWRGHHVRQVGVLVGDFVDVEEMGARNVPGQEPGAAVPGFVGQVFRGVEHQHAGLAKVFGEPGRRDQRLRH
jgi:hypothetical protein